MADPNLNYLHHHHHHHPSGPLPLPSLKQTLAGTSSPFDHIPPHALKYSQYPASPPGFPAPGVAGNVAHSFSHSQSSHSHGAASSAHRPPAMEPNASYPQLSRRPPSPITLPPITSLALFDRNDDSRPSLPPPRPPVHQQRAPSTHSSISPPDFRPFGAPGFENNNANGAAVFAGEALGRPLTAASASAFRRMPAPLPPSPASRTHFGSRGMQLDIPSPSPQSNVHARHRSQPKWTPGSGSGASRAAMELDVDVGFDEYHDGSDAFMQHREAQHFNFESLPPSTTTSTPRNSFQLPPYHPVSDSDSRRPHFSNGWEAPYTTSYTPSHPEPIQPSTPLEIKFAPFGSSFSSTSSAASDHQHPHPYPFSTTPSSANLPFRNTTASPSSPSNPPASPDSSSNRTASKSPTPSSDPYSHLMRRSTTPNGTKTYTCALCSRRYTRHCNLSTHLRSHALPRVHPCPHCPSTFVRSHDLTRHLKTHSAEKPFQCPRCGRGFARRDALKRHEKLAGEAGAEAGCDGRRKGVIAERMRRMQMKVEGLEREREGLRVEAERARREKERVLEAARRGEL